MASRKGDEPPSSCKRLVSWKRVTEPDMAYVTLQDKKMKVKNPVWRRKHHKKQNDFWAQNAQTN